LPFFRSSLDGNATHVLWDYSKPEVDTATKLIVKLQQRFWRFSAAGQMQEWRCEIDAI